MFVSNKSILFLAFFFCSSCIVSQSNNKPPFNFRDTGISFSSYMQGKLSSDSTMKKILWNGCEERFLIIEFEFNRDGTLVKAIPSYNAYHKVYKLAIEYLEGSVLYWEIDKKWADKRILLPILYSASCEKEGLLMTPFGGALFKDLYLFQNYQYAPDFRPDIEEIYPYRDVTILPLVFLRGPYD